jgi:membrane protease YdiL (CAAX protease family)
MNWSLLPIDRIDWAGVLSWPTTNKPALIVLATVILVYPVSYFVPWLFPGLLRRWLLTERSVAIWSVLLSRVWGAFVLGIPAVWIALADLPPSANRYGLNLNRAGISIVVAVTAWIMVWIAFAILVRVWPGFFKGYPEIHVRRWTVGLVVLNTVSWIVYLIPYEFLFRGFLLYPLAEAYGGAIAIAVTTGLYSFTHLVKEPQEQISTIFVGVLFGFVGLWTGSLLAPVLIHCFTAPVTEIFALRAKPEVRFGRVVDPATA